MPDVPTQQYEPFSNDPPKNTAGEKSAQDRKALVQAYRRCFETESGKRVLSDLKHAFGWERWEGDNTDDMALVARRALAKAALYHIERMLRRDPHVRKPKRQEAPPQ